MASPIQPSDRVRQVVVFILALVAIAGAFIGSGALGGIPIQDAAGGALAADATLIAPAGPAFSIWSVIYLGLLAYAIWQLLPGQTTRSVHRRVGYLIALSMILNAGWIATVQVDLLSWSVVVIVFLLIVLGTTFSRVVRTPKEAAPRAQQIVESIVLDGTIGLYLGWVTIATAANISAWLTDVGFNGFGIEPDAWGIGVVAAAAFFGVATAMLSHGRLTPALALAWGLAWVAVARFTGEPRSRAVAIAALIAAIAVVVVAIVQRVIVHRASVRTVPAT